MSHRKTQPGLSGEQGAAAIEMAILMPIYMVVFFALLFLGYLTLGMARQQQAAAFAGWVSGTQSSEELLERFYPWVHDAARGTYGDGVGGEHEMSLHVLADRVTHPEGYPRRTLEDIMARMAIGQPRQRFDWGPDGVQSRIIFLQTDFGRYLTETGMAQPHGHPIAPPPPNVVRATDALNGLGAGSWVARREAEIRMRFRPTYMRWAFREDTAGDFTREEYLGAGPPEHTGAPEFDARVAVVGRGPLRRYAAGEGGATGGAVLHDTMRLMNRSLPPPMDPVRLEQVVTAMGILDGRSIYWPRP